MILSALVYSNHFVSTILSNDILSIYHFVCYHFVLEPYIPTRVLRSNDQHLLEKPKSSTATDSRAFRNSALAVWNSLSVNTHCATSPGSFKQLLKTELFASAFIGS